MPDVHPRVGPHPGWWVWRMLNVSDGPNNREGPQVREPSKCLGTGRATKRLTPRSFLVTIYRRLKIRL